MFAPLPKIDPAHRTVFKPFGALVARLELLVARRSELTAELVAHVAEVDVRRLYLTRACQSMFGYCHDLLHLPESTAYRLIGAGRVARRFPVIFDLLASGKLHLAAVCLLAPHLTADNAAALLAEAVHLSKRKLQKLLATRFPAADVPAQVRTLPRRKQPPAAPAPNATAPAGAATAGAALQAPAAPEASTGAEPSSSSSPSPSSPSPAEPAIPAEPVTPATWAAGGGPPPGSAAATGAALLRLEVTSAPEKAAAQVPAPGRATPEAPQARPVPPPRAAHRGGEATPLSGTRYKVTFTAGDTLHDKLRQAQDLLGRHVARDDLETVFELALDALLRDLRRQRFAQTQRPRRSPEPRPSEPHEAPSKRPPDASPSEAAPLEASPAAASPPAGEARTKAAVPPDGHASGPGREPAASRAPSRLPSRLGGASPARGSRHIPSAVKRAVAERDGYRCTFVDPTTGRRCPARSELQYHHRLPFARGGASELDNVFLACRGHNLHAALSDFGARWMSRYLPEIAPSPESPGVPADPARNPQVPLPASTATRSGASKGAESSPSVLESEPPIDQREQRRQLQRSFAGHSDATTGRRGGVVRSHRDEPPIGVRPT